MVNMVIVDF